nr:hypothetical protein [Mycobacterium sp. 1164966.3]
MPRNTAAECISRELAIVANESGATVVFLKSHPAWAAAHRREAARMEAMRRHPSFLAKQRAAAAHGGDSQRLSVASGCATSAKRRPGRRHLVAVDSVSTNR